MVAKIFTVLLVLGSGYAAAQMTSISQGWQLVLNIGFGTGAVYILRWYWSRVNAWSEIVAMAVAAAVTILLSRVSFEGSGAVVYAKTAIITTAVTTVAWLIATFVTSPESDEKLLSFYRRVHPSVYGWKRIAKLAPDMPEVRDLASNTFNWVWGACWCTAACSGSGNWFSRTG